MHSEDVLVDVAQELAHVRGFGRNDEVDVDLHEVDRVERDSGIDLDEDDVVREQVHPIGSFPELLEVAHERHEHVPDHEFPERVIPLSGDLDDGRYDAQHSGHRKDCEHEVCEREGPEVEEERK